MPTTIRNTDILFNDGTTLSTAAGAVTTTSVLNATAGAAVGAVGTYVLAGIISSSSVARNGTIAGSSLRVAAFGIGSIMWNTGSVGGAFANYAIPTGVALSGTWRAFGDATYTNSGGCTPATVWGANLFLRIS